MTKSDTSPNFSSILDDSPTEIERPKPLPEGTYVCTVGTPRYDKSSKKGTPFVEFILRPMAADEDVDAEELAEILGDHSLSERQIKATYYLTEDAAWRLDEFHTHCGLDLEDEASRRTRNDLVANSSVLAYIKHEPSEDGTQTFAKLRRTAPAE